MVDRIIDLSKEAKTIMSKEGYGWFLDDDNEDYLATDAILVHQEEAEDFQKAAEECYGLYAKGLDHVVKNKLWSKLGLPEAIVPLIQHDLDRNLPHICGRLDLAGGIENLPTKLIEFNADTCSLMPESAYFQAWIHDSVKEQFKGQFNFLLSDLTESFEKLKKQFGDRPATLLVCSLGYEEDRLNLNVIKAAAEAAGFAVDYADLEKVIFAEDGVFLEADGEYIQYYFVYKFVPWEFIIFEEPELLDILVDLSLNHDLIVLNPAYTIAFQAKHMLSILHELFPDHPYLLPTFDWGGALAGKAHVQKANFGRMGENITMLDGNGKIVAETDGDFGKDTKVYQAFAKMYQDEDGDNYQGSVFLSNGKASCLCFRRRDDWIIDDDSEFVSHVLFGS